MLPQVPRALAHACAAVVFVPRARAPPTGGLAGIILPPIPDPIGSFTARWVAAGCMPSAARQGRAPARVDRLVAVHADDSTT